MQIIDNIQYGESFFRNLQKKGLLDEFIINNIDQLIGKKVWAFYRNFNKTGMIKNYNKIFYTLKNEKSIQNYFFNILKIPKEELPYTSVYFELCEIFT